jgi:hypothetical protein
VLSDDDDGPSLARPAARTRAPHPRWAAEALRPRSTAAWRLTRDGARQTLDRLRAARGVAEAELRSDVALGRSGAERLLRLQVAFAEDQYQVEQRLDRAWRGSQWLGLVRRAQLADVALARAWRRNAEGDTAYLRGLRLL